MAVAACMTAGAVSFKRLYKASDRTINRTPKTTYISRLVQKMTPCFSTSRAAFWAGSVMLG